MPKIYKIQLNKTVFFKPHSITNVLKDIEGFQNKVMWHWNPSSLIKIKCVVPSFSLRDEITTDGFGTTTIDELRCAGALEIKQRKMIKLSGDLVLNGPKNTLSLLG